MPHGGRDNALGEVEVASVVDSMRRREAAVVPEDL